jgi:hypothetical protein
MLKLYSRMTRCETQRSSLMAGVNLIRRAASVAASLTPSGSPLMTVISPDASV